jgi:hypothetical protein
MDSPPHGQAVGDVSCQATGGRLQQVCLLHVLPDWRALKLGDQNSPEWNVPMLLRACS